MSRRFNNHNHCICIDFCRSGPYNEKQPKGLNTRGMKKFFVIALVAMAAAVSARADINVNWLSTVPGATTTIWSYTINVTSSQIVQSGNFFTIYDFGNIVPNSDHAPAGWTLSTSFTGPTPNKVLPPDDPSILNLTWTYSGPTIPTETYNLGPFSVEVDGIQTEFRHTYFTGAGTMSVGPEAGSIIGNIAPIVVPNGAVPEPSSLALIAAAGVFGFAVRTAARRRKN